MLDYLSPAATPKEMLAERCGYASDFLGEFIVDCPRPLYLDDVCTVPDTTDNLLRYTHFSIMMSRSRRMAMYVAVNIDGAKAVSVPRKNNKWAYDSRIPIEAQAGNELYKNNLLDRGHLVRREDPNWGEDAAAANKDTFHFTNCAPQMEGFNQKTWLGLENYILHNTRQWQERVSVFTGPVFSDDDLLYRGFRIPRAFWKVIAFVSDSGKPSATAYLIEQTRELDNLEAAFGAFQTWQCSIKRIEALTQLSFAGLAAYDVLPAGAQLLSSPADSRL